MHMLAVKARESMSGSLRGPISPRAELVGEIDTKAPFQSVKAAVSLFGEVSFTKTHPITRRSSSDERVLEKETQHHMMLRELDYYKEQLKNAEAVKSQALKDLQRSQRTLHELTNKLELLSESKQASIRATDAAKLRLQHLEEKQTLRAQLSCDAWKLDLENEREAYKACTFQLAACKQELATLRQDFNLGLEQKLAVFQEAENTQARAQARAEAQACLKKEVEDLRQALAELELEANRAEKEHSQAMAEKENLLRARQAEMERARNEILRLKEEYEPEEILQKKLEQTMETVKILQTQQKDIQGTDLYALMTTFSDLEKSKNALNETLREEESLHALIDSERKQVEEMKLQRLKLETKVQKDESMVQEMQANLEMRKVELEEAMSGCASVMQSSIDKFMAEAKKAQVKAQQNKKESEILKLEAEALRLATKEADEKLHAALEESETAKKAADDKIYKYQGNKNGASKVIRLSDEDFKSINTKIQGFKIEADLKVATAVAHVESIKENERAVMEKLKVAARENEAIELGIKEAVKRADMAEAAKRMVENELQKWRLNEKSKVAKVPKKSNTA